MNAALAAGSSLAANSLSQHLLQPAEIQPSLRGAFRRGHCAVAQRHRLSLAAEAQVAPPQAPAPVRPKPRPQLAFYRKYTEGILRRYIRMSMQLGKVPCLLNRGELFRAKVSNYRMESFEDVVIFCHDIERSIQRLTAMQQALIDNIAVKGYTVKETATLLRLDPETVVRRYARALDQLTAVLLEVELLKVLTY
jgi:hypothetical protein